MQLGAELNYWLFDVKRLGVTLAQTVPNLSLSCIDEYYAPMDEDELLLLNLSDRRSRIRLIKHHDEDTIFVFGRTVIPQNTYMRYRDCFDSLGDNSIGEHFLFKNTHTRSDFYVQQCSFETLKRKLNCGGDLPKKTLWMRASIFTLDSEHRLLIEEFFVHMPPVLHHA